MSGIEGLETLSLITTDHGGVTCGSCAGNLGWPGKVFMV